MSRVPDFDRALAILEDFMRTAGSERYSLLFDVWDLKVRREDDANLGWKTQRAGRNLPPYAASCRTTPSTFPHAAERGSINS